MEAVLLNMANLQLLEFCKEVGIDPSGSHVEKVGRGFVYHLIDDNSGKAFVGLEFHKSSVPTRTWFHGAIEQGRKVEA